MLISLQNVTLYKNPLEYNERLPSEKPTAFEALNIFEARARRSRERAVIVQWSTAAA